MSVARVTEISSRSEQSFEDAINQGIDRANKTLRNVKGGVDQGAGRSTSRTARSSATGSTCW